jgi:V/A-type H+-transporting ATPase subunit I
MKGSGGLLESLGNLLGSLQVLSVEAGNKDSFNRLMRICFIMGAVHLSAAHLWRAKCQWPDPRFLNNVGWAIVLWGTFGLINLLLLKDRFDWNTPFPYLLITGGVLVVAFADPGRNVAKSLAVGLFGSLLPAIATLSDILSYIRLMAVGLAGSVLAVSFNNLALQAGVLGIFVLVFGHTLNIGLCLIALFAHGVRLNVLEFSSNAGMEWSGYPYEPFSKKVEEN